MIPYKTLILVHHSLIQHTFQIFIWLRIFDKVIKWTERRLLKRKFFISITSVFLEKHLFPHDIMMIYKEKDIIKRNLNITLGETADAFSRLPPSFFSYWASFSPHSNEPNIQHLRYLLLLNKLWYIETVPESHGQGLFSCDQFRNTDLSFEIRIF